MAESPFTDLGRPPLRAASLTRGLVRPGGLWRRIDVVAETGSTNADLVAVARAGAAEGSVLVAEAQTAGRGRLDRSWVIPPRAGLTFSVLLRPGPPPAGWTWIPLLAGLAVAEAVREISGRALGEAVDARLKWPNDVVVGGRKLAGVLAEGVTTGPRDAVAGADAVAEAGAEVPSRSPARPAAVVVGVGLNVTADAAELPVAAATSLALEGADGTDRDPLLRAILRRLEHRYAEWTSAAGDAERCGLRSAYAESCVTLGRQVRVELPGGGTVTGRAADVDADGRLVVNGRAVGAGDVVHVR